MWEHKGNYAKLQDLINSFFEDNPEDVFPGVLLFYKTPDDKTVEPFEVAIVPLPPGDKNMINAVVEGLLDKARTNKEIAYVLTAREARALLIEKEELGDTPMDDAMVKFPDRVQDVIMVELLDKERSLFSMNKIDMGGKKFVIKYEDLKPADARWSSASGNPPPDTTLH